MKTKLNRKRLSLKTKERLLSAAGALTEITPILAVLGINFNEYFVRGGSGVQVGFGGMLALVLIIMLSKDKMTALRGVWGYLVVFLLAVFLRPIIDDIVLLTGMALIGKTTDSIFIRVPLKRVRAARARGEQDKPIESTNSEFFKLIDERLKQYGGNKHE